MPALFRSEHKAKKEYCCSSCGRDIHTGERYSRSFGSSDDAMKNPKPHTLVECLVCADLWAKRSEDLKTPKAEVVKVPKSLIDSIFNVSVINYCSAMGKRKYVRELLALAGRKI